MLAGLASPRRARADAAGGRPEGDVPSGTSSGAVSLGQRAAASGLRFGSASDVEIQTAPGAYAEAFAVQCRLLAPNMGWHRVAPLPRATRPAWEDASGD